MGAGTDSRAPPAQGKGADVRKIRVIAPVTGGPFAVIILPLMVAEEAMRYLVLAIALLLAACQTTGESEVSQIRETKIGETKCKIISPRTTCTGMYQDIACREYGVRLKCDNKARSMECRSNGVRMKCTSDLEITKCRQYGIRTVCTSGDKPGGDKMECWQRGVRLTCTRGAEKIKCRYNGFKASCETFLVAGQSGPPQNPTLTAKHFPIIPAIIWFVETSDEGWDF